MVNLNSIKYSPSFSGIKYFSYFLLFTFVYISVSYGIINDICGKEIKYSANTNKNIKDNIILNLNNNKIIGILDNKSKNYNSGTFINDLIDQFIYKINHTLTPCSEYKNNYSSINIKIKIK